MPDVTNLLSLRYPTLDDIVTAVDYQNLANDIDAQLTVTDALRQQNLHRPSTSATASSQAVTLNSLRNINFDITNWSSPSSFHPGNTSIFTCPSPGLYFVSAYLQVVGIVTETSVLSAISVSGTTIYQASEIQGSQLLGTKQNVKGLVICGPGDTIIIQGKYTGTTAGNMQGGVYMFKLASL